MATAQSAASTVAKSRIPSVKPPRSSVIKRLTERDRSRLERILSEPICYMDHPSFSNSKRAKSLFPELFSEVASCQPWCNAAHARKNTPDSPSVLPKTLSTQQEQRLFLRLNYARYRISKIVQQFDGKTLTAQAVREILWWNHIAHRTQDEIVQANVPLVLAMAKRTRLGNIDYAELISEGNMALLRSVDKFDCGRGYKFSTYACRAILKSFSRVAMKIGRYRGRFPVVFDPSLERSDYLEQQRLLHEEDCIDELRGIFKNNSADLNEVEVKVIQARFALEKIEGWNNVGPQTLEQVGTMIGVTKERVRQIQNRALGKLKEKLQDDFLAA